MGDIETYEMISAFVLGCMDNGNFEQFKDYCDNHGKLPQKTFGELQNIAALIPALLDISYPDPKLKDAVAKNILSYQEKIKAKIRAQKVATNVDTKTVVENNVTQSVSKVDDEQNAEIHSDVSDEIKQPQNRSSLGKDSANKIENNYIEKANAPLKGKKHKDKKLLTLENTNGSFNSQKNRTSQLPWIIFLAISILTIIASVYFYMNTNSLKKQNSKLTREINSLKANLRKESNYANTNRKIIDFLNYNGLDIVNFQKRDNSSDASGKLFISFSNKEALLDAENLPILSEGKVFQLWLITKNISYSLLKFIPSPGTKYYSMPKLPFVPKNEVDLIRITVEPDTGSEYPTGNTILFGGFSQ